MYRRKLAALRRRRMRAGGAPMSDRRETAGAMRAGSAAQASSSSTARAAAKRSVLMTSTRSNDVSSLSGMKERCRLLLPARHAASGVHTANYRVRMHMWRSARTNVHADTHACAANCLGAQRQGSHPSETTGLANAKCGACACQRGGAEGVNQVRTRARARTDMQPDRPPRPRPRRCWEKGRRRSCLTWT